MNTQATGEIRPNTTQKPDDLSSFLDQIAAFDIERQSVTAAGIPALERLVIVANRDSGQAATVRRFLLGLYNGYRFPFNLVTLRGLDKDLFDDCMAVLTLDARATAKEVHQYLDNGGERFESWASDESGQLRGESPERQNGYTETPRKVSLDEVLAEQAFERGIVPMPLDADLLIRRIEQGGHSGKFLADAFLCTYRPHAFNHPLMEVNRLDAEAFRLFHQCLHIRHVPGWSDTALYDIEKRVRAAMKEGEKQNRRATRRGIAKAKAGLEGKGGAV